MATDMDAFAEVVVTTLQRALAPVLADVKVLQAQAAERGSVLSDMAAIRERLAVIESKDFASKADVHEAISAKTIDFADLRALVMKGLEAAA